MSARAAGVSSRLIALIGGVVLVTVLYLAKAVLIPLALAVLLSFLLAPLVRRLERARLGRGLSVAVTLGIALSSVFAICALLVVQTIEFSARLPGYRDTIQQKLDVVREETREIDQLLGVKEVFVEQSATGVKKTTRGPLPVTVVGAGRDRLESIRDLVGPLLAPAAMCGLVLVFVAFMLAQWDDLRDRLLRLLGQGHLSVTTQALEEASRRVSRYLSMQLLVNAIVGAALCIGLYAVGVPNAPLFGVLAVLLRFVPYIGIWIAAALPLLTAFATTAGFAPIALTLTLFVVVEIIAAYVLEPWLYGSGTGLSPIGVLISFVFWGWLWGGVGLLLATPLMVCILVAGRYIPQLEPLNVIFSDEHALPDSARLYHRLLALDTDEADRIVEVSRKQHGSAAALYDQVLTPALVLSERDRDADALSEERRRVVYDSLESYVEDAEPRDTRRISRRPRVLCVPAHDTADQLTALMAAHVLRSAAVDAAALPHAGSSQETLSHVSENEPDIVVVASLPPLAMGHARDCCQRLRARSPRLQIVVGTWRPDGIASPATAARLSAAGADRVVGSFEELTATVLAMLPERPPRVRELLPSGHDLPDASSHRFARESAGNS
jgi:predicted PurR-regulated permease PerM/methylmalonyl-CoA mutase cobalamin-binding subunit